MNRPNLFHTFYLSVTVILCFLWSTTPTLSSYNLQLTGALTLIYFVSGMIHTKKDTSPRSSLFSSTILMTIALLLVYSTGSANSPLFFLLDFLLFALALLFQPFQAAVVSSLLIALFFYQNLNQLTPEVLINILSLAFVTPLAIIFGRNYLANLAQKGTISILTKTLHEEETDSLLWVSTSAKPTLSTILNSVSDLVIYFNSKGEHITSVPSGFVDKLKTIQKDLITLYSSTGEFEESIKKISDKVDEEV